MEFCKILIIDDDTDDIEILAEAFTQSGVESVHFVHTAMEAFLYLQTIEDPRNLPSLIVTDLYLPGISGRQFLEDLKKMDKYAHIHVIILSSIKSEKEIEKYREMGAEDYLIKPTTYKEYVEVAKKMKEKLDLNSLRFCFCQ